MRTSIRLTVLAAAALALSTCAFATNTATATMNVSAYVPAACTLTVNPLAFGLYDPITANLTAPNHAQTSLFVTCTGGAPALITMDAGAHWASTPLTRTMVDGNPNGILNYSLFSGAVDSTPWGDATAATNNAAGKAYIGLGNTSTIPVYGTIAGAQLGSTSSWVNSGATQPLFTDTVTVSVIY
jgi:spore coat protein U-like protein